jgi:NodT family efflux transporter outer membrane factor (OMF) lipoprotein
VATLLRSALFLCFISLSACVNDADDATIKIATPTDFPYAQSIPSNKNKDVASDWPKTLGDKNLIALINKALEHSPSISEAHARLKQAESNLTIASASLYPNVIFSGFIPSFTGAHDWVTGGDAILNLQYDLDLFGKNIATINNKKFLKYSEDAALEEAKLILVTSIVYSYNELNYYYAQQDIYKQKLKLYNELVSIASARLQSGLDAQNSTNNNYESLFLVNTQLLEVQKNILQVKQELGYLVGMGPDFGLEISRPKINIKNAEVLQLPATLPLHLVARRPDIVVAKFKVWSTIEGIKNAKAKFYPDVNIIGLLGYMGPNFINAYAPGSSLHQIGPVITLPFFDTVSLTGNLNKKQAEYEEAVASYNSILNNAIKEVAVQLTVIKFLDKEIFDTKKVLMLAYDNHNIAYQKYVSGLFSKVDVIATADKQLSEEDNYLKLLIKRRNAQISLIKSLGGGYYES